MEKKDNRTLIQKITGSLRPRIITAILVIFLPLSAVTLLITQSVLRQSAEQIIESFQRELNVELDTLENSVTGVEDGMDDFVARYFSELNAKGVANRDIVNFDMLGQLDGVLRRAKLPAYFYLYNTDTGNTYIKDREIELSVEEEEAQKTAIRELAEQEIFTDSPELFKVMNYEIVRINGMEYLFRRFLYQNYTVGFLFPVAECICAQIADRYKDGTVYYFSDSPGILGEEKNEKLTKSWEELLKNTLFNRCITWESEKIPVKVGVCFRNSIALGRIPAGTWILVGVAFFCLLLIPFIWEILKWEVLMPLAKLLHGIEELAGGNLDYRIQDKARRNSVEMQYLFDSFDEMAEEIRLSKEKDQKVLKAELDNLRLQVNPHMLFNSFNMIYSLAQTGNFACIQDYSLYLVEYFRYALRKNDDFVPLDRELEFIENFINIQKIRFPNSFTCAYRIDDDCREALIPPLLIENFVENAAKYALIPGEMIEILINIRRDGEQMLISVCDTGKGIKEEILKEIRSGNPYVDKNGNKHIGIWNCMRRIEVFYGAKAELSIVSARNEGTQVFLTIPYLKGDINEAADCR